MPFGSATMISGQLRVCVEATKSQLGCGPGAGSIRLPPCALTNWPAQRSNRRTRTRATTSSSNVASAGGCGAGPSRIACRLRRPAHDDPGGATHRRRWPTSASPRHPALAAGVPQRWWRRRVPPRFRPACRGGSLSGCPGYMPRDEPRATPGPPRPASACAAMVRAWICVSATLRPNRHTACAMPGQDEAQHDDRRQQLQQGEPAAPAACFTPSVAAPCRGHALACRSSTDRRRPCSVHPIPRLRDRVEAVKRRQHRRPWSRSLAPSRLRLDADAPVEAVALVPLPVLRLVVRARRPPWRRPDGTARALNASHVSPGDTAASRSGRPCPPLYSTPSAPAPR